MVSHLDAWNPIKHSEFLLHESIHGLIAISKTWLYSKEWDYRLCLSHENGFQIRMYLLYCQTSKSPRRGSLAEFRGVSLCRAPGKVSLKNIQFLPLEVGEYFWTNKNNAVFWKYCFRVNSGFLKAVWKLPSLQIDCCHFQKL